MSDAVHIIERYVESLRNGKTKIQALAITYREVGSATFLTSVTTAIGFLTLTTSSIGPIVEFGIFTAVGVGIAFVLAFTLLPAILLLVNTPVVVQEKTLERFWNTFLNNTFLFVIRNQRAILFTFVLLSGSALYLTTQMKVDNTLLEDLSDEDPRKQDFFFFEKHFGGVRPFEMAVEASTIEDGIWNLAVLEQIQTVEGHLKEAYGIQSIISPVTLICSANKSLNGGSLDFYALPPTQKQLDKLVKRVSKMGELFRGWQTRTTEWKNARRRRLYPQQEK